MQQKKAGIKCIITPHGFENSTDLKLRFFIWLGCKALLYADAVAPLSPQLMLDSKNIGVPDERLFYIQNGVDLSEIETQRLKQNPFKNTGEKRIGFIGQIISRKNLHHLLDIFEALASKHENVRLLLIGDGDQRAEMELYAKKLNNSNKIEFLGFRDDRLSLLQSFDLFVMTSTLEGIPRCLMEACAMGIPIAAYNIPGVDKLIEHQETGLLAKLNNKEELLRYWEELLFDKESAKNLSERSREYVQKHYSAQRMSNEYMDLYTRTLS